MDCDQIFEELGLMAINIIASSSGSYGLHDKREFLDFFIRKDLKSLSKYWLRLSDQTRMLIVKEHSDEFLKLMAESGTKNNG
jgi:hypothetical protein